MPEATSIQCVLYNDSITVPIRKTIGAAGYDIFTPQDTIIEPKSQAMINCGFGLIMPPGWACQIISRSSTRCENVLDVFHGLIDSDFKHEIKLLIRNRASHPVKIFKNSRLAQLIIFKVHTRAFNVVTVDSIKQPPTPALEPQRGLNMGSTGV